jgi:prepilin-type N-terminal cleavage/methylation domain-containing protein
MRSQRAALDSRGFTLVELMVSMTLLLIVTGTVLESFQRSLGIGDLATQLADANQNLRAGADQLVKDLMQAGRIVGPEGVPIPGGAGAQAVLRPGPPGMSLTFDVSTTTNLPDITTGYRLGPAVNGQSTDLVTILTVDPFMPTVETPPSTAGAVDEGTLDPGGASVTLPAGAHWLLGDPANGVSPMQAGDLVLFKNSRGMAMQMVTSVDATHLFFAAGDSFHLNQRTAPQGTVMQIKDTTSTTSAWTEKTTLFRLLLISYYVDVTTTPGTPRLMRKVNNFTAQALAGAIEDLDLTYDLVDGAVNPSDVPQLPWTSGGVTYTSNQIRKVNLHAGVRSELRSRFTNDYVRNHITTSVDVRSLASVDRYVS